MNQKSHNYLILVLFISLSGCIKPDRSDSVSGFITDQRDEQVYPWLKIGHYNWMVQNLNYKGVKSYSIHSDSARFGRLYGFSEALNACPDGWHLPTDAEWAQLELTLGMSPKELYGPAFNRISGNVGIKLQSPTGWIRDSVFNDSLSGFNALPAGFYWPARDSVRAKGISTVFWTSTTVYSRNPFYREIFSDGIIVRRPTSRTQVFSIRCVQDD